MAGIKSAGFFVPEDIDVIRHIEGLNKKARLFEKRPGFDCLAPQSASGGNRGSSG